MPTTLYQAAGPGSMQTVAGPDGTGSVSSLPPSGAAGGDLSGTYPDPVVGPTTTGQRDTGVLGAVATTVDSYAIATVQDVEWDVVIFKAAVRWSATIRANISDGATPVSLVHGVVIGPPSGGTFDFTLAVDISAGLLRLRLTPASAGWRAYSRAKTFVV